MTTVRSRGGDALVLAVVGIGIAAVFFALLWPGRIMFSDGQYAAFFAPIEWWSDAWIGGWPAAADPAAYAFHPIRLLLRPFGSFNLFVLSGYLVAAAGVFTYLRALDASLPAAALAAVSFAFSGFMVGHAMHTSMLQATAWSVLALAGIETCLASDGKRGAVVTALAVATACLAGHNQLAMYGLIVLATYLAWRLPTAVGERRLRSWLAAVLAVVSGVALAAPALLLTVWYLADTPRSAVTYATFVSRAIPPQQLVATFFPFLFGGGTAPYEPASFGQSAFAATCLYVPFVVFLLAFVGVGARTRGAIGVYWTTMVVVATLLAVGDAVPALARLAFHVPLLDKFRAPSRHAMEIDLGLAVLGGLGLDRLWRAPRRRDWILPLLLATAVWLAGLGWLAREYVTIAERAHRLMRIDMPPLAGNPAILVPIFLGVTAVVVLVLAARRGRAAGSVAAILAVGAVQLASFVAWAPWRSGAVDASTLLPVPVEQLVATRIASEGGRVLNFRGNLGTILGPERSRLLGVPSANWYGPLAPHRALQALAMTTGGAIEEFPAHPPVAALDMYGVRYLAFDGAPTPYNASALDDDTRWRQVGRAGEAGVYENMRALPRAWLVGEWTRVTDADAVARITGKPAAPAFDPATHALVADVPSGRIEGFDAGRVRAMQAGGAVTVEVGSRTGGLLVASVNAVRGWTATIDGAPGDVLRTDHALVGVMVPPGDHVVALKFAIPGAAWRWGAFLCGAIGLGLLASGRLRGRAS